MRITQRVLVYDHDFLGGKYQDDVNEILSESIVRCSEIGGTHHLMRYAYSIINRVKNGGAPIIEFGTYRGGSALAFLAALHISEYRKTLITVDPYGMKPYELPDGNIVRTVGEVEYQEMMEVMGRVCKKFNLCHVHYKMSDEEYIERVHPNTILYGDGAGFISPHFAFVFLDAQHTPEPVVRQAKWAVANLVPGGAVLIDDVSGPRHAAVYDALQKEFPDGELLDIGGAKPFYVIEDKNI